MGRFALGLLIGRVLANKSTEKWIFYGGAGKATRALLTLLMFFLLSACFGDIVFDQESPSAVGSFTAVGGNAQVALSWANPTDGDLAGVMIRRSTVTHPTTHTDGQEVFNGFGTSATDTGLTNATFYFYSAFAYDQTQNFAPGVQATAITTTAGDTTPPSNVSGFNAIAGNGQVVLSWSNPGDGDFAGVRVCWSAMVQPSDSGACGTETVDVVAPATGTTVSGLTNETLFYFTVFAYDNATTPNYADGSTAQATATNTIPARTPAVLSAGSIHTCAIIGGAVECWGTTEPIPALSAPTEISAGSQFNCALDSTGVVCWGSNNDGQSTVPTLTLPTQVEAGGIHACALDATGVVCWGRNDYGQSTVPLLSSPILISAGAFYTCAIDSLGAVCWGRNSLGEGTVPTLSNPTQISAFSQHTCAIDDSGVVCWGNNSSGETDVPALLNPTEIAVGFTHSCAIDDSGAVCWGSNSNGQTQVPSLVGPYAITAGDRHSCAMDSGGVKCWGDLVVDFPFP